MSSRDYCKEMRTVIDQATGNEGYVPRLAATEIVEKLRATDRELLLGWLEQQAEQFIWQAINDRDRSTRTYIRRRTGSKAFAAANERHKAGDGAAIRDFLALPFTVGDGTRRQLAKLNAVDLGYVADTYRGRSRDNALTAAFLEALAKKIGDGLVEEHFTNERLSVMFDSLN